MNKLLQKQGGYKAYCNKDKQQVNLYKVLERGRSRIQRIVEEYKKLKEGEYAISCSLDRNETFSD